MSIYGRKNVSANCVKHLVDCLLQKSDEYEIKKIHHDTCYIYDVNKNIVCFCDHNYGDTVQEAEYDIGLNDAVKHIDIRFKDLFADVAFYKKIYNLVYSHYSIQKQNNVLQQNMNSDLNIQTIYSLLYDKTRSKISSQQMDGFENIIKQIISAKLPIDVIKRIIYKFVPKNKDMDDNILDCETMYLYYTNKGNLWSYVGEKHVLNMNSVTSQSEKIIKKVQNAYEKQK